MEDPLDFTGVFYMFLLQLTVILVVIGIIWYFLAPYIAEPFKTIAIVLVILLVCLWLLSAVGLVPKFT